MHITLFPLLHLSLCILTTSVTATDPTDPTDPTNLSATNTTSTTNAVRAISALGVEPVEPRPIKQATRASIVRRLQNVESRQSSPWSAKRSHDPDHRRGMRLVPRASAGLYSTCTGSLLTGQGYAMYPGWDILGDDVGLLLLSSGSSACAACSACSSSLPASKRKL